MTNTALDELGPVDVLVVEFPADTANLTVEIAERLLDFVSAGTIRVIDMLILAPPHLTETVDAWLAQSQREVISCSNRARSPMLLSS